MTERDQRINQITDHTTAVCALIYQQSDGRSLDALTIATSSVVAMIGMVFAEDSLELRRAAYDTAIRAMTTGLRNALNLPAEH